MSCETYTTEIDNHQYAYTQLPATKSLILKYELIGIFGNTIVDLFKTLGKSDDEQLKIFSKAIQEVFSDNDPEKMVSLISKIFIPCFKDKERVDIDRDFTGKFSEMYRVLAWILTKEYSGFLEEMQGLLD